MSEEKKTFFDRFFAVMDKFSAGLNKVNGLMAVKDSFIDLMPFIIVGSFATLFGSVICGSAGSLASFGLKNGEVVNVLGNLTRFKPLFDAINYATMNMLAVLLAYLMGSTYSRYFKDMPKQVAGLNSLVCYLILVPTSISATLKNADGISVTGAVNNVLRNNYTNSQGLFLALIVGLIATKILAAILKSGKLAIHMPETVPSGVAASFSVLFPLIAVATIFGIIGFVFRSISGLYVSDAIYRFLQRPMEGVMQQPWGVIILVLFCQAFWVVGIHGSNVVDVVRSSVGLATIAANLTAHEAGAQMTNIFTYTFWNTYCTIGGSGCTLGLIIAIFIVAKKEDIKTIGKLSVAPAIFGINEPMIFGLPIVLNPMFVIPFILAPVVSATIGYISTAIGFASPAMYTVPWTTPFLVNAFISTGGSIGTLITQLICIVVVTLIYLPFVSMNNLKKDEVTV